VKQTTKNAIQGEEKRDEREPDLNEPEEDEEPHCVLPSQHGIDQESNGKHASNSTTGIQKIAEGDGFRDGGEAKTYDQ
jgi:hypothetical protein